MDSVMTWFKLLHPQAWVGRGEFGLAWNRRNPLDSCFSRIQDGDFLVIHHRKFLILGALNKLVDTCRLLSEKCADNFFNSYTNNLARGEQIFLLR